MEAPADVTASKVFRDALKQNRVALRSGMHRDDIDDVEIVVGEDLDVAATRQVLKIGATALDAGATGEIDAADVLEVIALVPPAATAPPPTAISNAPARSSAPPFLAAPSAPLVAPWPVVDEDDAFLSHAEPASAYGVTFDFEDASARSSAVTPQAPRRRLGWIVGTVLACCMALLVGGLMAGGAESSASSGSSATVSAAGAAAQTSPFSPTLRSTPASLPVAGEGSGGVATIDVRNLPAAMIGTVVAPAGGLVIDGKRVAGSSALVACGKHVVKTAGHLARSPSVRPGQPARLVDVPCGGQVTVH